MLFGLLDTFASTSEPSSSKGKYPPLRIVDTPVRVLKDLKDHLEKNGYENLQVQGEYLDLYAERDGYEYSVQLTVYGGACLLSFSVLGESKRGRVWGELRRLYEELETLFEGRIKQEGTQSGQ